MKRFHLGPALVLLSIVLAGTARAEGGADARTIRLDHGLAVTLPEGWSLDKPGEDPRDARGRLRVRLVCDTQVCRHTQEVCTLYLRRDPVGDEGADEAHLDGLYASPMARYTRIRDALKSTGKDATLRGTFAKVRFGPRTWYAVETEAAHAFKSGLFAATVIEGRYLGAICKTCETGEVRHGSARALLATARVPTAAAQDDRPQPPDVARPAPVHAVVGGIAREVRLDALQRFGVVPLATLCSVRRPEEPMLASLLEDTCAPPGRRNSARTKADRGNATLAIANATLSELEALSAAAREPRLREVNGLVLEGLRAGVSNGQIPALADRYDELGEQARDGTLFEIASELHLAHAAFCTPEDARCRGSAETDAASDLVQAGRWLNDVERLRRAGEMAERVERTPASGGWPDADGRFQAQDVAGSAYSYAAQFAVPLERLPFIQRAVAAYERALPSADAQAPSFSSARLWQNLGAAYIDRGSLTGDEADFTRGVALYERALPLFDPKADRQALARTRSNMGRARTRIAQRTRDLALHDRAVADHHAAIIGYEEAAEGLDAGFARYRLAQDLGDKAKTADQLDADLAAARVAPTDERRTRLVSTAADSRGEALNELAKAVPVFVRAGAVQFLERARETEAEIRAAQGVPGRSK